MFNFSYSDQGNIQKIRMNFEPNDDLLSLLVFSKLKFKVFEIDILPERQIDNFRWLLQPSPQLYGLSQKLTITSAFNS